ncbi:putative serine-rich protein [Diaporthe ampelina]|uniref:Putative serine-rich protein n=1 Tax=Diaporthe ampelina TaxID=1214573 RepID=A0A0G2HUS7_9PEZI|nr:putative serine-rich protein [Diaporthe ampelina]
MDSFDISGLAGVSQQSLLFGTYPQPQPSTIKRQQNSQTNFNLPLYNSIEDWSAAELTTDSAPSPGSASPVSPIFPGFASSFTTGDEWTSWDKLEQSPGSDFFLKNELLDSPDLSSIPVMSPELNRMDASNPGLDDVVQFGSEGVNDTRPLFQSPQMNLGMPSRQPSSVPAQGPNSGLPTPPEPTQASQQRRYPARANLKRKSSSDEDASSPSSPRSSCSPPPPQRRHTAPSTKEESPSTTASKPALGPKKTAHNMIEKRYRTNLNDKIAALRDSVPALRVMVHRLEHADDEVNSSANIMDEIKAEAGLDIEDDLGGVTPAHKLNKATILSKATEYIAHLERKNRSLAKENSALRNRVEGFEMLVMSSRGGHSQRPMWQ